MGNIKTINRRYGSNTNTIEQVGESTTPLSASAIFTSDSFLNDSEPAVKTSITADADGTLKLQFSWDNSNWDAEAEYAYGANDLLGISLTNIAPYCRIVFVNGGSGQSFFRLKWGKGK